MTKTIKHIIAMALAVLMTVATFGAFAVSAAEETQNTNNVLYFENTKNWDNVYGYGFSNDGTAKTEFPGTEAKLVGKVVRDGEFVEVYAFIIDEGVDKVVFSEGFNHGQQSSDIDLNENSWGGILIVSLDKDNKAVIGHFFDPNTLLPC